MAAFSRAALLALLLFAGDAGRGWLFAGDAGSGWGTGSAVSGVAGTYRQVGPAIVVMTVAVRAAVIEVRLTGGGPPLGDGSAPADCVVRAMGRLDDRLLRAVFQPIETEDFSYGSAQARAENRRLVVAFARDAADVEEADTDGYCGLGIEFRGHYRKTL